MKIKKPSIPLMLLLSSFLLVNCAGSVYDAGRSLLRKKQYQGAIEHFRMAVESDFENYKNWRELGIAYSGIGRSDSALASLKAANRINPKDGKTILYMGMVYESQEDYEAAINYYRKYTKIRGVNMRKKIRKRLTISAQKLIRIRKEVLTTFKEPKSTPDNTIAVLYFNNVSRSKQLDPLRKGLAEVMSFGLSKVKALRVLERIRLEFLLAELKLDGKKNPARIGRLLGARTIIIGNFTQIDDQIIRIDASLVRIETSKIETFTHVKGSTNEIFRLVGELTQKITDELGIELSISERQAIYEPPTERMIDFLTFSKNLHLQDEETLEQLRKIETLPELQETAIEDLLIRANEGRLVASGAQVNAGIVPGQDERDSIQEASGTEGFQGVPVQIEIIIPPLPNQNQ